MFYNFMVTYGNRYIDLEKQSTDYNFILDNFILDNFILVMETNKIETKLYLFEKNKLIYEGKELKYINYNISIDVNGSINELIYLIKKEN